MGRETKGRGRQTVTQMEVSKSIELKAAVNCGQCVLEKKYNSK